MYMYKLYKDWAEYKKRNAKKFKNWRKKQEGVDIGSTCYDLNPLLMTSFEDFLNEMSQVKKKK